MVEDAARARTNTRAFLDEGVTNFGMAPDDGHSVAAADRTGAFVARLWREGTELIVRMRHTVDLHQDDTVADSRGNLEHVASAVVREIHGWIERFATTTAEPTAPDDEPLTGQ